MKVSIYSQSYGSQSWDFEAECDVAECFPDDPESAAVAICDLERKGEHITGGGAAPLFRLVRWEPTPTERDMAAGRRAPSLV
jgi:hypothetical protein